ncbi:TetR/AcrR family transcriptional regulator [Natranaerofaba carboxydovora]|uniref:TetR/AcrR family transcriptional regulator n=1 Tax=Natranaerofaba carboxydovora TaxID=2742683 RepID=UPI001F147257|nr:TetR/AcrR family transcriptional regulator [Natranaerofaba carboxydovora]UMZ72766.1 HTH-type transcriptional repressor [Natranaerofaba carboxydovora]
MSRTKSNQTRGKIIQAAISLFAEKGFYNTSTLEIANNAEVAEGTVFKHFKTKKNLLLELVDEINAEEISSLLQQAADNETKVILREFLKNHKQLIKDNFPLIKVIIYEAQFFPELKEKFIEDVALKIFSPLESYIEDKVAKGEFKNFTPQITSRAFIGMIVSFIAWQDVLKADNYKSFDEIEVIEEVVEIFLSGVKS